MDTRKKLTKSRQQRVWGGVAGGLAEYFNIDPVLVRILFIFFTFSGGAALFLYIALLIIMPEDLYVYRRNGSYKKYDYSLYGKK